MFSMTPSRSAATSDCLDPVDACQLVEDEGLDARLARRAAGAAPVWARAATLINKQPAAKAAIGFEMDMMERASPRLQGVAGFVSDFDVKTL